MHNSITIVFSTRTNDDKSQDFVSHIKDTCGCSANIKMFYNPNGLGLSQIYHDVIESDDIQGIIVFIHDDIEFLKSGWGEEVIKLFERNKDYGIIGVAGAAQFDENGAWWNYPKRYGQVLHKSGGKSWLTAFSPLLQKDLEEVCVIDGLFIAVEKSRISSNFDLDVDGFDFYDINFCLDNFLDRETKIGVTTNIRLAHKSIGELKPSWFENKEKMINKYKNIFPINIKK